MANYIFKRTISIPIYTGGDGRYLYNLNAQDQTVSVIDCSNNTVISTITLTASKNFCSLFYRSVDQSVYVLGTQYRDRIDANPASGTFNTVVQSGFSPTIDSAAGSAARFTYMQAPIDLFGNSQELYTLTATSLATSRTNVISRNGSFYDQGFRVGHNTGLNNHFHPRSRKMTFSGHAGGGGSAIYDVDEAAANNDFTTIFPYKISQSKYSPPYIYNGAYPLLFANGYVCASGTTLRFVKYENMCGPLAKSLTLSGTFSRPLIEYAPNAKRLFVTSFHTQNTIEVVNLNVATASIATLGTIDRTAYKATNESGCSNMLYNPYNGKMYTQGAALSSTSGVNKIHVYDPTLAVASMYQSSITVGEIVSTLRQGVYSANTMCTNRTRFYEFMDKYL